MVKRIFRYLKGTSSKKFHILHNQERLMKAYVDSDWAGSVSDAKSTTGLVIMIGNSAVI